MDIKEIENIENKIYDLLFEKKEDQFIQLIAELIEKINCKKDISNKLCKLILFFYKTLWNTIKKIEPIKSFNRIYAETMLIQKYGWSSPPFPIQELFRLYSKYKNTNDKRITIISLGSGKSYTESLYLRIYSILGDILDKEFVFYAIENKDNEYFISINNSEYNIFYYLKNDFNKIFQEDFKNINLIQTEDTQEEFKKIINNNCDPIHLISQWPNSNTDKQYNSKEAYNRRFLLDCLKLLEESDIYSHFTLGVGDSASCSEELNKYIEDFNELDSFTKINSLEWRSIISDANFTFEFIKKEIVNSKKSSSDEKLSNDKLSIENKQPTLKELIEEFLYLVKIQNTNFKEDIELLLIKNKNLNNVENEHNLLMIIIIDALNICKTRNKDIINKFKDPEMNNHFSILKKNNDFNKNYKILKNIFKNLNNKNIELIKFTTTMNLLSKLDENLRNKFIENIDVFSNIFQEALYLVM